MSSILVLNGVNLGSLGGRQPEVYGNTTLGDLEKDLRTRFSKVSFEFRQTDYEGELVGWIQASTAGGIVINPGAWTHYSYAVHDALEAVHVPKVEVHISNIHTREAWRRVSVVSPAVDAVVAGMGLHGYGAAVAYILSRGSEGEA